MAVSPVRSSRGPKPLPRTKVPSQWAWHWARGTELVVRYFVADASETLHPAQVALLLSQEVATRTE